MTPPPLALDDAALRERAEKIVGFVYARPGKRTEAVEGVMGLLLTLHDDVRDTARAEQRQEWLKILCPGCDLDHVLDNGRVWGFCGAWKVIAGSESEKDWAAAIRAQGEKR